MLHQVAASMDLGDGTEASVGRMGLQRDLATRLPTFTFRIEDSSLEASFVALP